MMRAVPSKNGLFFLLTFFGVVAAIIMAPRGNDNAEAINSR